MAVPHSNVGYLRFVLHQETDGILTARRRSAAMAQRVPEMREIKTLLRVLVELGVEKIRLTGDDPAQRGDLEEVVGMVAGLDGVTEVAVTSRGEGLLGRLGPLTKRGLTGVNFDVDALRAKKYKAITGSSGFKQVRAAIDEAVSADLKVKLNVVLQRGVNDDEIAGFVSLAQKRPIQVRFVEWNTSTDVIASASRFISTREAMAAIKPPLVPRPPLATDGPALVYSMPNHRGTIGFIPNITEHFCSSCNRIGLTDTGEIMSCIFGRGLNLIRHLRSRGGINSVTAFVDRVLRRKALLASKLRDIPGARVPSEAEGVPQLQT
jgi:cyclic pyranopterin phosphate synthase